MIARYPSRRSGEALGVLVLAALGGAWLCLSLSALHRLDPGAVLLIACALAVAVVPAAPALRVSSLRSLRAGAGARTIGRTIGIVNAVQWAAIAGVYAGLGAIHRLDLFVPAIAAIVGLHFVPLGKRLGAPALYAAAGALVAWALLERVLLGTENPALCALGTGVILWASSVALMLSMRGQRHGAPA